MHIATKIVQIFVHETANLNCELDERGKNEMHPNDSNRIVLEKNKQEKNKPQKEKKAIEKLGF